MPRGAEDDIVGGIAGRKRLNRARHPCGLPTGPKRDVVLLNARLASRGGQGGNHRRRRRARPDADRKRGGRRDACLLRRGIEQVAHAGGKDEHGNHSRRTGRRGPGPRGGAPCGTPRRGVGGGRPRPARDRRLPFRGGARAPACPSSASKEASPSKGLIIARLPSTSPRLKTPALPPCRCSPSPPAFWAATTACDIAARPWIFPACARTSRSTPHTIYEAKLLGASAVLLIASCGHGRRSGPRASGSATSWGCRLWWKPTTRPKCARRSRRAPAWWA